MKKVLIIVLIVILLVLGYFTIFNGLSIFGIKILSVFEIKNQNEQLDSQLQKASNLTSVDRPKAMSELNDSAKALVIAREEYNDKILYSSKEDIELATQGIQYEMEYLWTKIGNHATKNGIVPKLTIRQSSSGVSNQYDLAFVATGKYVSISEFIAALENDSSLNFKIENTKITPFEGNTENLQATFDVKGISIKIDNITSPNLNTNNTADTAQGTQTNQTATTNGNTITEGGNP